MKPNLRDTERDARWYLVVIIIVACFITVIEGEEYKAPALKTPDPIKLEKIKPLPKNKMYGDFSPYIAEFKKLYTKYTHDNLRIGILKIYLGDPFTTTGGFDPDVQVGGLCIHSEPPTIIIRELNWSVRSEIEKKDIIFHELGHCLLHLLHQQVGIMKAYAFDPHALEDDFLRYFFESGKIEKQIWEYNHKPRYIETIEYEAYSE